MPEKTKCSKAVKAREDEGKRISRELHDGIAQDMAILNMQLDQLLKKWGDLIPELQNIRDSAREIQKELRKFCAQLRPDISLEIGLENALWELVEGVRKRTSIQIDVLAEGKFPRLSRQEELTFFRIAQEGLNNICKHSQATRVLLSVICGKKALAITLSDNGKGFKTNQKKRGCLGLKGMKERAALIHAKLNIESVENYGTTVKIELKK